MRQHLRTRRTNCGALPIDIPSANFSSVLLSNGNNASSIGWLEEEAVVVVKVQRGMWVAFKVKLILLSDGERREEAYFER